LSNLLKKHVLPRLAKKIGGATGRRPAGATALRNLLNVRWGEKKESFLGFGWCESPRVGQKIGGAGDQGDQILQSGGKKITKTISVLKNSSWQWEAIGGGKK